MAFPAECLGENLAVLSVGLSAARELLYRSHLRSSPQQGGLFTLARTSKHHGKPFRSSPNIRHSPSKRTFEERW